MSILPVTVIGDKILRKEVEKVKDVDNEIIELITNMWETMKNASGIGLAASQVGADKKIFILDISQLEDYEDTKPIVFINPEIVEYSEEKEIFEEGCLSIPDIRADVERPKEITIEYRDTDMNEKVLKADELLARVIQHEYDHLMGILFTDLVDDETKKKLKKPLQKIKKRKVEVSYPISENIDYQLAV
jgi:peptide deformylase